MKLSISEIVRKRFKPLIKVFEAQSPDDVEKMIIRPPEAANSELTLLNDAKGVWMWSDLFGAQFRNVTDGMAEYMRYKQRRLMSLA